MDEFPKLTKVPSPNGAQAAATQMMGQGRIMPPRGVKERVVATVAPPIAEALIATAMGLFAAIPAVIAYNRFADRVVRLEYRYDGFMEEFSSILQRHARAKLGG